MDLLIYSPAIQLLGTVDVYSSLRWRRRYFEPGEVELHCQATAANIALLQAGNIIHRVDRTEAAIIEGKGIETKDTGDDLTITARMGSSMLEQRIITPAINFTGTVEAAMRKIVSDNAITQRPIALLTLGSLIGHAATCNLQGGQGKGLLAALQALGRSAGLGFRARMDVVAAQWIFEVYSGIDRSVSQTALPYVLFSDEYQNITGPKYTSNAASHKNFAYVAGEGEGANRVIATVDQTGGAPRRELWVDARDLQRGALSEAAYSAQLVQRGLEKLAEAATVENFAAEAADSINYRYGVDWDIGDIVSFEKWGILLTQRVTEVEEVYEGGTVSITPTCGNPLPESLNLEG